MRASLALVGDHFDLHLHALGQVAHGKGSARRQDLTADVLGVHFVHRGKVGDVGKQYGGFDGVSKEILDTVEIDAKYQGYWQKGLEQIEKAKK